MPAVRRRTTAAPKPTTTRRRDRVEEPEEEEDEVEATSRPAPARRKSSTTRVKRAPAPVEDEEEEEEEEDDWEDPDEEEEAEVEEEEEDEEEEPPPPRRKAAAAKKAAPRRTRRPAPAEDEEEEEDEEPAPPRRKAAATTKKVARRPRPVAEDDDEEEEEEAPSRRRRTTTKTKSGLPSGVKTGWGGVESLRKERGSGAVRLDLGKDPELIKFLEPGPMVTYAQHWISEGGKGGNRPYRCPVTDCPLCDLGDRANQVVVFNVLHLSDEEGPKNKILNLGVRAAESLQDAATTRKGGKPNIQKDFFTGSKSGQGQTSQTNFRPIKLEDIEEDWEEILDVLDLDAIDDIIAEAKENVFDLSIVQTTSRKQLLDLAQYLKDDDD